jgi:hypothetical protein
MIKAKLYSYKIQNKKLRSNNNNGDNNNQDVICETRKRNK